MSKILDPLGNFFSSSLVMGLLFKKFLLKLLPNGEQLINRLLVDKNVVSIFLVNLTLEVLKPLIFFFFCNYVKFTFWKHFVNCSKNCFT